jgi:hypothetical protein
VQQTLIDSQWARRYTTRAISVIAMFDPAYEQNPKAAELSIQAVLRPPPKHKSKKAHAKPKRAAKSAGNVGKAPNADSQNTAST